MDMGIADLVTLYLKRFLPIVFRAKQHLQHQFTQIPQQIGIRRLLAIAILT